MSASVTPLRFQPPEVPEDKAREGYYALLARLFYAGPDAALLAAIGGAGRIAGEGEQSALGGAWNRLVSGVRHPPWNLRPDGRRQHRWQKKARIPVKPKPVFPDDTGRKHLVISDHSLLAPVCLVTGK